MVQLVPLPADVRPGTGAFALRRVIEVVTSGLEPGHPVVRRACTLLSAVGGPATREGAEQSPRAELAIALDAEADPESYRLVVSPDRIELTGDEPGLGHGLATLEQLARGPAAEIGAVTVLDAPRFAWRGLMVDLARHFVRPEILREVIDLAALYRLNRLHLHLTDDQGWRLEIPSRPELVERSSSTAVGGDAGGFLTGADYAALVAYAAERGVVVIPEVDVPGHVNAVLHAVAELNPDGVATEVYTGIEVGFSALDLSLPATEPFLRDVLGDVAALTPGEWLHIGGDEVKTMAPADYRDFVALASRIGTEAGKRVVVWQEGGKAELPPGSLVQLWDTGSDPAPVREAVARGARAIMSPGSRVYLDMKYAPGHPLGLEWAGFTDVRDSYSWDPGTWVEGVEEQSVEGVEAAVFTETIVTRDDLFAMLLPRLAAIAEVAWTPQAARDDVEGFAERLATHQAIWDARGWSFHPSPQVPWAGPGGVSSRP